MYGNILIILAIILCVYLLKDVAHDLEIFNNKKGK